MKTKESITYLKPSGTITEPEKTLNRDVWKFQMCWNSKLDMLNSVLGQYKRIDKILEANGNGALALTHQKRCSNGRLQNVEEFCDEFLDEGPEQEMQEIILTKSLLSLTLEKKILSADMIIHEQILGLDWTPPSNTNFTKKDLPSYKTAMFVVNNVLKKKNIHDVKIQTVYGKDLRENEKAPEVLEGHKRLLRHIFELLADQSGFLMEEKLDKLLTPYTEDEKTLVRLDNVFVAINIRTETDIQEMKKVFLPYTACLICDRGINSETSIDYQNFEVPKSKSGSRQHSILQIRDLEEKVSKLRIQAREGSENIAENSIKHSSALNGDSHQHQQDSITKTSQISDHPISTTYTADRSDLPSISDKGDLQDSLTEKNISTESGKSVKAKCDITHPLMIEKYFVLKALKDFVSVYHADRLKVLSGIEEKLDNKRFTISRLLTMEDISSYWDNYREIIPDKLEYQWDGVFLGLTKYLTLLQKRHELNLKARALRRQNLDMKRLLSYYKVSDHEFKLPVILPVPNKPISPEEIIALISKLGF